MFFDRKTSFLFISRLYSRSKEVNFLKNRVYFFIEVIKFLGFYQQYSFLHEQKDKK